MKSLAGEGHEQHEAVSLRETGRAIAWLDDQTVPIQRTRLRTVNKRERPLSNYELFQWSGPILACVWDQMMPREFEAQL